MANGGRTFMLIYPQREELYAAKFGLFRGIINLCVRGYNGHSDRSFHRSYQPKEVRPVKIKYVEENIEKNQKYTEKINRPASS